MIKPVFKYRSYKDFLKATIDREQRGIVKRLADAAGCQRSYLSQALSSHVNLTAEHLYGIGRFLSMKEDEIDFLILLLELEKTSAPAYRERLEKKVQALNDKQNRLSSRVDNRDRSKVQEAYYSAWYYSALHIATSIDELKADSDFAKYLGLPIQAVSAAFRELESWGYVVFKNEAWSYNGAAQVHLDDASYLNRMNHLNWRTQALSRPLVPTRDVHYTSVFTVSKDDVGKLREALLSFIEEQRSTIQQSDSEELVSFGCDFFNLTPR